MNIVFLLVVLILLVVIIIQYRQGKKRTHELYDIQRKLQTIVAGATNEKVLFFTNDPALQALLIELNRMLDASQRAALAFTRTEDSMRRMLSNISHDLKTPLTVVCGYLEILQLNPEMHVDERNELTAKVHTKAIEVLGLIHSFFDLAKLEAGDTDLPIGKVQLNELCRMSILQHYEVLTARGMEVVIKIPDQSIQAKGNEEALKRVLNNLISNAIQYGGDGNILGLTLREDVGSAYIEVWDRGKGISEMHKDAVFERMYTLEDSRNRSYQGSGLGLTITKRLIEQMGGKIHLHSKPYEKTMFTIQLVQMRY
ncbi:sensor histidine kinase [Paenibacillus sp. KN14-4R]|uniref:sensor histidine kinase n=1 Tax=Paenibacillus sp. KN14-4R TaxID=3445773 RepID=UPI003FA058F9